jgi:hypothetical protein
LVSDHQFIVQPVSWSLYRLSHHDIHNNILPVRTALLTPWLPCYRTAMPSMAYAPRPKKQLSIDCVPCEIRAEAEETLEHRAHNTTQHSIAMSQHSVYIKASFAIRIKKRPIQVAVEQRVKFITARHITGGDRNKRNTR